MNVSGLIWGEIRSLWCDGLEEYISDLWNIVDFITNVFYVIWLALRMTSFYITWVRILKLYFRFQITTEYTKPEGAVERHYLNQNSPR